MKKLLSLIVAAVMVLALLPMGAIAEEMQSLFPAVRSETIAKPVEGVKAPAFPKSPANDFREETTLYSWDFSGDPVADGWQFIDRDGDGKTWRTNTSYYHSGSPSIMSGSYDGSACHPDNWAITPAIELPDEGNATLRFWLKGHSASYAETYAVFIGNTDVPDEMTQFVNDTQTVGTSWEQMEFDISDYLGQTIYIAFVNHNCYNQWLLYLDDVSIAGDPEGVPVTPTPAPTAIPEGYLNDAMNAEDTEVTLQFESGGDYPWLVMDDEDDRVYAMSGNKGVHRTTSTVTASFTLDGEYILSFDYMAWGEGTSSIWDECIFKLDGTEVFKKGAEDEPWQNFAMEDPLVSGEHTIEFSFIKDYIEDGAGDFFKIDNVKLEPAPEKELIEQIEVIFDEPEFGMAPDMNVSVPDGVPYSIQEFQWLYSIDGDWQPMTEGMLFDNEEYDYYLEVCVVPDEGYTCSNDTTVIANGSDEYLDYYYWNDQQMWAGFGSYNVARELIDPVGILRLDKPVYGNEPDYQAVPYNTDDPYAISIEWFKNGESMQQGEVFDDETAEYHALITLTAFEGCCFPDEPSQVIVSGLSDYILNYETLENGTVFTITLGMFTVIPPISEIAIEGFVEPAWEATPFYAVSVPEDANYHIGEVVWYYYDEAGELNILEPGAPFDNSDLAYHAEIQVIPNEGYSLAEELTATINGSEEFVLNVWQGGMGESCWVITINFIVAPPSEDELWGDANGDGEVTMEDALLLMRHIIDIESVEEENLEWCDVNGDGAVDLADALLIMRKVMGTIEAFPVES